MACSDGGNDNGLEARVRSLVAQMTIEEKVAQMAGDGPIPLAEGGVLWGAPGSSDLAYRLSSWPTVPGASRRSRARPPFPWAWPGAQPGIPRSSAASAPQWAVSCRAAGGNVLLAPTINNLRHPAWGRAQETYGEDVQLLAQMAVAFVKGAQEYVLASPKHYAANSIEDTRFQVDVTIDERTLREIYLPQFRAAIVEGGAAAVMTAYNSVNGQFCGENEQLLKHILKTEWGFNGFVMSDWVFGTQSTLGSARNGLDLEMPVARFYGDDLLAAIADGSVAESLVDDAVGRMVRKKLEYGLDRPSGLDAGVVGGEEHLALARETAAMGAVLLKNEAETLPLSASALDRIVVVGVLADTANTGDRGSSDTRPAFVVTPLQGIAAAPWRRGHRGAHCQRQPRSRRPGTDRIRRCGHRRDRPHRR